MIIFRGNIDYNKSYIIINFRCYQMQQFRMQSIQYVGYKYFQTDVSNQYIQPQQFAKLLRSQRLNDTKILIVYWPSVIDDHDYFRQMCESLLTLPKLEIFKMISNGQNSKNAFKQLGKRFKSVVQKQWWKGEDWKF